MFEQILALVKEHISSNPELAAAIPAEHAETVHQEIATHLHETLQNDAAAAATGTPAAAGLGGGLLSTIENSLASGGIGTSAITGGLIGALTSKFGLPSAVTGAIAAAIPGLLQKFVTKSNTPTA